MKRVSRRRFIEHSMLATATAAFVPAIPTLAAPMVRRPFSRNDVVRIGVVGVRGRGRAHVGEFKLSPDAEVVAICDPDEGVLEGAMNAVPDATYYRDIRKMLEDDSIDAISIATPNHWHSLASIWAIQAGKHVYVEKPISHNVMEGRRVVEAARKYDRIVQHGTQARSSAATREAIAWLHAGGLGKIHIARALCYKSRGSIGKVDGPQQPPSTCDYDLWTGPAAMEPLRRTNLHYDWHWVFNTGSGDIGNQGVHQMDIARWGLNKDDFPTQVVGCGGRLGYDDDGNTPNTQISIYDYGDQKLIFEVRGLKTDAYKSAHIGVIFHCEHGYLVSASYAKVVAFDHDGNEVRTFTGGGNHFQNFLDAVREGNTDNMTAECIEGHRSAALCHLGNISYRLASPASLASSDTPFGADEAGNETFERFRDHLADNGLDPHGTTYMVGSSLAFDSTTERFVGHRASDANRLLTREARAPFVVPEQV